MPSSPTDMHARLVAWLSTPAAYDQAAARVEHIETHISDVFLTEQHAYKLKKPVRFDFLDFGTIDRRRTACAEELRLNRRLTRDVYLDVLPITRDPSGAFQFGGAGETVDWVVRMRRLPANRMLDTLIASGARIDREIRALASLLVEFYRNAPPAEQNPQRYLAQFEHHVRDNLATLLTSDCLDEAAQIAVRRAHAFQLSLLALEPRLLRERVAAGRVTEGHGDLRPEHVCLIDPPAVFDCIEFSAEFRTLDVADELSFLAMECERLGTPETGRSIWDAYVRATGDDAPARLLAFYRSYRAGVRAKVAALRAAQISGAEAAAQRALCADYLRVAVTDIAPFEKVRLIAVGGLMGTGKSTVSSAIAEQLGLSIFRSDALRRELLGSPGKDEAYDEGRYRPEARAQVYEELFLRAAEKLASRQSTVLDATFLSTDLRARLQSLAAHHGASLTFIRCECPAEVARQRISRRRGDPSDARPELFARQAEQWEPDPPGLQSETIDATLSMDEQLAACLAALSAT